MCGSKQVQAGPIAESQPTRAEDIHGRVAVLLQVLEVFRVVDMGTTTAWHTIREASVISGLPESTLRYYEQIGIIAPITRDPSSGHRVYSDADLERLTTVSCLAATGMPLESMRTYLANSQGGREGARRQMELLDAQALRLAAKAESIRMQQAYVSFKTLYWRAKAEGRDEEAQQLIEENRNIIEQVKRLQTDVKQ